MCCHLRVFPSHLAMLRQIYTTVNGMKVSWRGACEWWKDLLVWSFCASQTMHQATLIEHLPILSWCNCVLSWCCKFGVRRLHKISRWEEFRGCEVEDAKEARLSETELFTCFGCDFLYALLYSSSMILKTPTGSWPWTRSTLLLYGKAVRLSKGSSIRLIRCEFAPSSNSAVSQSLSSKYASAFEHSITFLITHGN